MDNFDILPADIQRKLALELSPPDMINLCLTSKQQMANICESKDFWLKKLEQDYPEALLITYRDNLPLINPKRTYLRKFQEVSKVVEELERKTGLKYKTIYSVYEDLIKSIDRWEIPGQMTHGDKTIQEFYRISTKTWEKIIPSLRKIIRKQIRYRKEAEELKRYL